MVDVALSTAKREVGCLSNILLQSLAGMETNASYKNVLYVNEYIWKFNWQKNWPQSEKLKRS